MMNLPKRGVSHFGMCCISWLSLLMDMAELAELKVLTIGSSNKAKC